MILQALSSHAPDHRLNLVYHTGVTALVPTCELSGVAVGVVLADKAANVVGAHA